MLIVVDVKFRDAGLFGGDADGSAWDAAPFLTHPFTQDWFPIQRHDAADHLLVGGVLQGKQVTQALRPFSDKFPVAETAAFRRGLASQSLDVPRIEGTGMDPQKVAWFNVHRGTPTLLSDSIVFREASRTGSCCG